MSATDKYDPDGIDKAARACEAKGCIIVYGGIVKKINETSGESKRILIVSDTFITFVKPIITKLSHTCYWSDLASIHTFEKDGLELNFKIVSKKSTKINLFRFRSRERPVIIRKIIDLLYHTMTESELSNIEVSEFQHPPITINPRGVFSRFDEHLVKGNVTLSISKLREQVKMDCQLTNPICIPKSIESQKEIKALFYALIGSPFTRAVFFPEIKDPEVVEKMYKYMALFVNFPAHIQFFSFKNSIIPKFDEFSNALIDKSQTNITGIGFRGIEMKEEDVQKVQKLVGEANLMSLRWCTISPEDSSESLLKDKKVRKSLRYLALDRTKGINLRQIAPKLSRIVVLSLEYSNLEIADIFKIINKSHLSELKMLNLSYNNASKCFETTSIPSNLQRIDISHVKFSNNVMKNILEVILTAEYDNGLKFYCDKYHTEDDQIDALANFENISSESLLEFSWRKNKIDKNLLEFLKNCPNLNKLMLEGSLFNTNEDNIVEEFASICSSLKNLTHLYICGTKKGELGTDFQNHLLDGLKQLPNLSYLDISNNSISDEGIKSIALSLKEFSSLTHIILDNNKITSIDPLKKLAEKAQQLFKNLYISWPINDIKSLLRNSVITESDVTNLISIFNQVTSSNISSTNHLSIPLDDGAVINSKSRITATNSSSVKNKASFFGKQRKQRSGSVFIRTGSVRNLKRALAEGNEQIQDPDSIFIEPFNVWFGSIDDTNFPLYLSEELASELNVTRYDPQNDFDDDDEVEYEIESDDEPKTRSIKVSSKRSLQNISNYSDSDDDNKTNQPIKKYVKPPPPLKPVNKVLNSTSKSQKSPTSTRSFRNNNIDDDDDEPGEVKERNVSIDNSDSDDFRKTSPKSVSQRYPSKSKQSPTSRFSQSQNARSPKSPSKTAAPSLDLDDSELADVAYGDQDNEAVPFEAPSWSFPVPRISRVSNSAFVSELNGKYSVASVINNLRSKK